MTESLPEPSRRLVTFDLDELYRQRAEVSGRIARDTRMLAGLEGTILMVEERLGLVAHDAETGGSQPTKAAQDRPTHRAMLLRVLADTGEAMGVRQLIDAVKERYGEEIPRTSVSPLLRKLAERKEVVHDRERSRWRIGRVEGEIVNFRQPRRARREVA